MPINPTAEKLIDAWLSGKGQNLTCPVCADRQWQKQPILDIAHAKSMNLNQTASFRADIDKSIFAPLVCGNCGYTVLLSAALLGLRE